MWLRGQRLSGPGARPATWPPVPQIRCGPRDGRGARKARTRNTVQTPTTMAMAMVRRPCARGAPCRTPACYRDVHRPLPVVAACAALLIGAVAAHGQAPNPEPPGAITGAATDVGRATATFGGTVDPNGAATTYTFEYGTTTNYGLTTTPQDAGAGADPVAVSVAVTGLTEDTTYHFRLVATNAAGTTRGTDATFRTAAGPRPPGASTGVARDVRPDAATLTATVDPNGQATRFFFEFGTSTRLGSRTPDQDAGSADGSRAVSAAIGGLRANTRYHYRVVAVNASGTTRGSTRSFVTLRGPTGVTAAVSPRVAPWGGSATVTGRVSGQGVSRVPVALQRSDWPFAGGFREVGRVNAERDGSFRLTVGPLWALARLRVVTRTSVVVTSNVVEVFNRPRVGLRVRRLLGGGVRLTGAIWPAVPDARVSLQRQGPSGRFVPVARAGVRVLSLNRSRYAFRVGPRRRAAIYRIVVRPNDNGAHVRGVSRELRVVGR